MAADKVYLTWGEVLAMIAMDEGAPQALKVYGIPRGGAVLAGILEATRGCVAVDDPNKADVIVDDIIDSGATQARYEETFKKPVWALMKKGSAHGWIVFPWEGNDPLKDIEDTVIRQLQFLGEDPNREGLKETPARAMKALLEMTSGYQQDPKKILSKVFVEPCDEMVVVRDIPFWSLCEHHLLPFHGTATVAYVPSGKIVGLSKIPRTIQAFARRLQVQERLTQQIAQAMNEALEPKGVGVLVKASHLCMAIRGIRSEGEMVTSCLLGAMKDDPKAREEFLALGRK